MWELGGGRRESVGVREREGDKKKNRLGKRYIMMDGKNIGLCQKKAGGDKK